MQALVPNAAIASVVNEYYRSPGIREPFFAVVADSTLDIPEGPTRVIVDDIFLCLLQSKDTKNCLEVAHMIASKLIVVFLGDGQGKRVCKMTGSLTNKTLYQWQKYVNNGG
jgi:hypothetical protein